MTRLGLVLRLFLVQALWNYRTMIGAGLAWVLLPTLRRVCGDDEVRLRETLARQARHFNAHPYLAGFAAGALSRLEEERVAPATIGRFRDALRGPLGSLGDSLIWVGWRPTCVLAAGAYGVAGGSPLVAVAGFLVLYNALHIFLRWRGVTAGLALGTGVGEALRRLHLLVWAERIGRVGVLLLGLLIGLSLTIGARSGFAPPAAAGIIAAAAALLLFSVGLSRGRSAWWWTPVVVPGTIVGLLVAQALL